MPLKTFANFSIHRKCALFKGVHQRGVIHPKKSVSIQRISTFVPSASAVQAEDIEIDPENEYLGVLQPIPSDTQRRKYMLEDTAKFIASDLKKLFETGEITSHRYDPSVKFEDPIVSYNSRDGYVFNIRMLRTLFKIKFSLHTVNVTGPEDITARWTMLMDFWLLPWQPTVTLTGKSIYKVEPDTGIILQHLDVWDSINHNKFLSLEGLAYVLSSAFAIKLTPSIESPAYDVLLRLKDYEVRQYEPFLVAEVDMGPGAGPASGSGFNDLAAYIFGRNQQGIKMEMTTPVFTQISSGQVSTSMQFVVESRYGTDPSSLPPPQDPKVSCKSAGVRYVAALTFSGWPLDYEVVAAERNLRDFLIRDGYSPAPGYLLARYNDPSTPPFLRRNEVLIRLDKFSWPPSTSS